ncbi:hypothetical protein [Flavobacterium sp.]|uniref:hypothetical protein n=1 Tax=Flavobacterium sp. TaxID=239 RepID=UPI0026237857|nr:hypothetical protein [Flavobacterium sp.]
MFTHSSLKWSQWKPMPQPESCRAIDAPIGPGIYQIKTSNTNQFILFGIGVQCQKRMKSLYPKPYGVGTRNNSDKRDFILKHWKSLEYRTLSTATREEAK